MRLLVKLLDASYEQFYNIKKNYNSDSGFDLYCVDDVTIEPWQVGTINSGVSCAPFMRFKHLNEKNIFTSFIETTNPLFDCPNEMNESISGYYLYPRSSISKTPLMLANSVGIVDLSYRGQILSKVRNLSAEPYTVKKGTSLFQLCCPNLKPFTEIRFVSNLDKTERGSGGFGSTN